MESSSPGTPSPVTIRGSLTLFGFPPGNLEARVIRRSGRWRGFRAAGFMAGGLVLAPLLGMIPPHAPWAAGSLGLGMLLGARKWRQRMTLISFNGECPRCGGDLSLKKGAGLRDNMPVSCEHCHHDSILRLGSEAPE